MFQNHVPHSEIPSWHRIISTFSSSLIALTENWIFLYPNLHKQSLYGIISSMLSTLDLNLSGLISKFLIYSIVLLICFGINCPFPLPCRLCTFIDFPLISGCINKESPSLHSRATFQSIIQTLVPHFDEVEVGTGYLTPFRFELSSIPIFTNNTHGTNYPC